MSLASNTIKPSEGAMSLQTVTIRLPNILYRKIEQRARQMKRTFEDELVNVVRMALPSLDDLPSDIVDDMAQLTFLTDAELRRSATITVSPQESERMETLLFKQQREGLTAAEQEEANQLLHRYDRTMLVRAQAMLLLTERGIKISNVRTQ